MAALRERAAVRRGHDQELRERNDLDLQDAKRQAALKAREDARAAKVRRPGLTLCLSLPWLRPASAVASQLAPLF